METERSSHGASGLSTPGLGPIGPAGVHAVPIWVRDCKLSGAGDICILSLIATTTQLSNKDSGVRSCQSSSLFSHRGLRGSFRTGLGKHWPMACEGQFGKAWTGASTTGYTSAISTSRYSGDTSLSCELPEACEGNW